MPRQADTFKVGIKSPLNNGIICQSGNDLGGDLLTAGKVNDLNGSAVHAVGKQKYLKYGRLHIAVDPTLGEVLIAVGLNID